MVLQSQSVGFRGAEGKAHGAAGRRRGGFQLWSRCWRDDESTGRGVELTV